MKHLLSSVSLSLTLLCAATAPPPQPIPVGSIEAPPGSRPDFDIAADQARHVLHFVWRNGDAIRYVASRDAGVTWSEPQVVVPEKARGGVRIALDSTGTLHMAYAMVRQDAPNNKVGGDMWYQSFDGRAWSAPVQVFFLTPTEKFAIAATAPRITVDGNDNVHIIGWKTVASAESWKALMRCAYARKLKGAAKFEPTEEFSYGRHEDGGGSTGDVVTDSHGNVHVFYLSWRPHHWPITHFTRSKDGLWSEKVDVFEATSTDFGLRAVVDRNDVIHLAGEKPSMDNPKPFLPVYWTYFNNKADPSKMQIVHQIPDVWEFGTDLLVTPGGDVWMSRGHWQKDEPFPFMGRYVHMDAKTGKWSDPENLSPPSYRNADFKYGEVPRFVIYDGKVRIFYIEAPPNGNYHYFQKILGDAVK